jgi:signal peptidase I
MRTRVIGIVLGVVVPFALASLLTAMALRWLVPGPAEAGGGSLLAALAQLGERHGLILTVGFFLLFSALVRVWLPRPARHVASPASSRLLLVVGVAAAAGAGLLLRRTGFESVQVVSASMLPSVLPGDRLLVDKRAGAPRRGEVIVFRAPEAGEGPGDLVKRVIGLPGDRITMDGARPVINGQAVRSCDAGLYVYFGPGGDRLTRGRLMVEWLEGSAGPHLAVHEPGAPGFVSYLVPPGELFVLGDNRGLSNDSRSWRGGRGAGVPLGQVQGRVRRVVAGRRRDGHLDPGRLWQALGTELDLSGVDIASLRAGVARCLAGGPTATTVSRS